jgi:hypothetical protein
VPRIEQGHPTGPPAPGRSAGFPPTTGRSTPPSALPGSGRPFLDRPGRPSRYQVGGLALALLRPDRFPGRAARGGPLRHRGRRHRREERRPDDGHRLGECPPSGTSVSTLLGLWVGFFGAPGWPAGRRAPATSWRDLGVRFRWVDLGGSPSGSGADRHRHHLRPFQHDIHNFNGPSQKLTGGAHGAGFVVAPGHGDPGTVHGGAVLPRAALQGAGPPVHAHRAGNRRARGSPESSWPSIVDGLLFGLAHGEWVQLAGLAPSGWSWPPSRTAPGASA